MNKRLLQRVRSAKKLLGFTVVFGFLEGLMIILQAVYLARIVDQVFLQEYTLKMVLPEMYMLLGWIVLRAVIKAIGEKLSVHMAIRIKTSLREQVIQHVFQLGPPYIKGERTGELVNTIYEGVEQLEIYLSRYLPQISLAALIPMAIFAIAVRTDWLSAVIFAVTAPLIIFFMILIGLSAQAKTNKQWKTLGILSAHFLDVLRGLTTLKLFNRSKAQIKIIGRITEEYRKTTMGTLRIAFLSSLVLELVATLSIAIVAVTLGLKLLAGHIDFYSAFLLLLLAPEFYAPIRMLGTQYHSGMNGVSAADRIFDILDTKSMGNVEMEQGDAAGINEGNDGYTITFDQVGFTYPNADVPTLSRISFTIEPGERFAIVGASGAGKTTLQDLLLGFIQPTEGKILINGVPLQDLSPDWWHQQIALVAQQTHLFHGSIVDNIRLAAPEASLEQVKWAAAQAHSDEFIDDLPEGYSTILGESAALSGGQIQRLSIARAYLKDAPILLMDEPTAHLDIESEQAVQHTMGHLLQGKSAMIIAHRLGTIQHANQILVMDKGNIVERGTHEKLLQKGGLYRRLFTAYQGSDSDALYPLLEVSGR